MRTSPRGPVLPNRCSFLLCALLCACAEPPADEADTAGARPVELEQPLHNVTIPIGEGHAVSYRAYADGALIIGESVQHERDAVLTKSAGAAATGPVALFRAVYPEREVPNSLHALQAYLDRAAPARTVDDLAASLGSGGGSLTNVARSYDKASNDAQSFQSAYGCFFGSDDAYNLCTLSWAGDANAWASSRWAVYKLAPYREGLRFTTSINGAPRLSMPVGEGGFWVQLQAGPLRSDGARTYPDVVPHRIDISSTGEHHWSARFHNYETSNANCAESWSYDRSHEPVKGGASGPFCTSHYGTL